MPTETELKLLLPPDEHHRVSSLALVRKHASGRAVRKRLRSIYFDTPNLELLDRGVVLRLRKDGRRWLQAVKTEGRGKGGLHERGEYEVEVTGPEIDFEQIPDLPGLALLASDKSRQALQPLFETEFWRTAWLLEWPDGTAVELALDSGDVRHGEKVEPINELELELKRGTKEGLFEIALALGEHLTVRLENVSKAERGYRLVRPVVEKPMKAKRVSLHRAMTIEDAFAAILWNSLDQVQVNGAAILAGDGLEGVHQMRVGLRRFRSCLAHSRRWLPKELRKGMWQDVKGLNVALSAARDWDVFLQEHVRPMTSTLADDHPLQAVRAAAEMKRLECYVALHHVLKAREYSLLLLQLVSWVACRKWRQGMSPDQQKAFRQPALKAAREVLRRGHKQLLRRGKGSETMEDSALHDLRIDVKKQRYAVEFFESLFSRKAVRRYGDALRALQETLGHISDATVAHGLLAELRDMKVPASSNAYMEGWYARSKVDCLRGLPAAWRFFRKLKPYWK